MWRLTSATSQTVGIDWCNIFDCVIGFVEFGDWLVDQLNIGGSWRSTSWRWGSWGSTSARLSRHLPPGSQVASRVPIWGRPNPTLRLFQIIVRFQKYFWLSCLLIKSCSCWFLKAYSSTESRTIGKLTTSKGNQSKLEQRRKSLVMIFPRPHARPWTKQINIAKGTTDPRVEFISQVLTQILIKFWFQNLD